MPYIKQTERTAIDKAVAEIVKVIYSPGTLNYAITKILLAYTDVEQRSYITYNEIIGVLECAKQEFYRREIVPYEDEKKKENGDVFIPSPGPVKPTKSASRS